MELLQARMAPIDLESRIGKSVVVTKATPLSQAGGFYCAKCDCVIKDSVNYLDHINGKKHQMNLGRKMKVERSTVDEIKATFATKKQKIDDDAKEYNLQDRLQEVAEEDQKQRDHRKEKKRKASKSRLEDQSDDVDPDLAAMMGFGGFGGSKKKN